MEQINLPGEARVMANKIWDSALPSPYREEAREFTKSEFEGVIASALRHVGERAWEEALVAASRCSGYHNTYPALVKAEAMNPYRAKRNGETL